MEYIGIQSQIRRNNTLSTILLMGFPAVLLALTYIFIYVTTKPSMDYELTDEILSRFLYSLPWVIGAVLIWFSIAWLTNDQMIESATGSKPLLRTENMRVYNLVENLCISRGMKTPKINIIEDDSLNAFASGINNRTYTISLSRGIINKLNDDELEAVIAHELSHIRNRDVRLVIISIIFVGIFAFIAQIAFRSLRYAGGGKGKKAGALILLVLALAIVGYVLSIFFRFAISRKRELMADAGSAEMTKRPEALASALRKISKDPVIEAVQRDDVAQLFIEHPEAESKGMFSFFSSLFDTHPPIEKRIQYLEQF